MHLEVKVRHPCVTGFTDVTNDLASSDHRPNFDTGRKRGQVCVIEVGGVGRAEPERVTTERADEVELLLGDRAVDDRENRSA